MPLKGWHRLDATLWRMRAAFYLSRFFAVVPCVFGEDRRTFVDDRKEGNCSVMNGSSTTLRAGGIGSCLVGAVGR
jgi:hypothetical protein